jgi:acetyltransferase-like isoleucine patch superfamily enzyme
MGGGALRFLSKSLSLGIGLPLCFTARLRCEDWKRSRHRQQREYLLSLRLIVGDHVWIGDDVGILSLAQVTIESNVCVARRSFLCTARHDLQKF